MNQRVNIDFFFYSVYPPFYSTMNQGFWNCKTSIEPKRSVYLERLPAHLQPPLQTNTNIHCLACSSATLFFRFIYLSPYAACPILDIPGRFTKAVHNFCSYFTIYFKCLSVSLVLMQSSYTETSANKLCTPIP